jgi:tRNA-specific 2-thiouridylase
MGFPLPIPAAVAEAVAPGTGVLVAASGGVDSSVTLALLAHLECRITAVTFKNYCYATEGAHAKACCSLAAIEDARRIAQRFGAQHWVRDVSQDFRRTVIEPFVSEYAAGRTPNPCVVCNAHVRFPELVRLAQQLDLQLVATGHYARLTRQDRHWLLRRAVDQQKDQAYFLYRVAPSLWPHICFPLGWYHKSQVRRAAQELQLFPAAKVESQEICFVPDGDRSFLFPPSTRSQAGEITDRAGKVMGRHRGLEHYTIGQRRGLGIAAREPLYVLALDSRRNRVVVGPQRDLEVRRVLCDGFVAAVGDLAAEGPPAAPRATWLARIRHRHPGTPVAHWRIQGDELTVDLAAPAKAVAPGQSLVLYKDDVVLGGGRILASQ